MTVSKDGNPDGAQRFEARPEINQAECKGCCRCIAACPEEALFLSDRFNQRGYRVAEYKGQGCIGCGQCYYACPEPYTIRVVVPGKKKRGGSDA